MTTNLAIRYGARRSGVARTALNFCNRRCGRQVTVRGI